MATQNNTFAKALNRIDPTQGLVGYVKDVKPYHTKIMDVLVEYVYSERISTTFSEKIKWQIQLTRPDVDVQYACGYGIAWDFVPSAVAVDSAMRQVNIVQAISAIESPLPNYDKSHSFLIEPQVYEPVTFSVASPRSNQLVMSTEHSIVGKSSATSVWRVADPTGEVVQSLSIGTFPKFVYVLSDSSGVGLGKYTVNAPPVFSGGITTITVVEDIPGQVAGDGKLAIPRSSHSLDVVGVTNGVNGSWIVGGDVTALLNAGKRFEVINNTGMTDRIYTVVTSAYSAGQTRIYVDAVVPSATVSGSVTFSTLPQWQSGTAVELLAAPPGSMPAPLTVGSTYYFQPAADAAYFTLSTVRYASSPSDYVNLSGYGSGVFSIQRTETFIPGTTVTVDNSYRNRNDGDYVVRSTIKEGGHERVYVYKPVESSTPPSVLFDGTMNMKAFGFDAPAYCPPSKTGDLHTDTYIHETIKFTFEINLNDFVGVASSENPRRGFGESPFSDYRYSPYGTYSTDIPVAVTSGTHPLSAAHTVLPTGIDTQLFGVGALDETIEFATRLYGGKA